MATEKDAGGWTSEEGTRWFERGRQKAEGKTAHGQFIGRMNVENEKSSNTYGRVTV